MKELKGQIRLGRITSNTEANYFIIEVEDYTSGVQFIRVRIDLTAFADMMTNRLAACSFELRGIERVGMIREHKKEIIFVPSDYTNRKEVGAAAIQPYEVDGWVGDVSDTHNGHRCTKYEKGGGYYNVSFIRFVPATEAENED